jgi:hypothetical protein
MNFLADLNLDLDLEADSDSDFNLSAMCLRHASSILVPRQILNLN